MDWANPLEKSPHPFGVRYFCNGYTVENDGIYQRGRQMFGPYCKLDEERNWSSSHALLEMPLEAVSMSLVNGRTVPQNRTTV